MDDSNPDKKTLLEVLYKGGLDLKTILKLRQSLAKLCNVYESVENNAEMNYIRVLMTVFSKEVACESNDFPADFEQVQVGFDQLSK